MTLSQQFTDPVSFGPRRRQRPRHNASNPHYKPVRIVTCTICNTRLLEKHKAEHLCKRIFNNGTTAGASLSTTNHPQNELPSIPSLRTYQGPPRLRAAKPNLTNTFHLTKSSSTWNRPGTSSSDARLSTITSTTTPSSLRRTPSTARPTKHHIREISPNTPIPMRRMRCRGSTAASGRRRVASRAPAQHQYSAHENTERQQALGAFVEHIKGIQKEKGRELASRRQEERKRAYIFRRMQERESKV